MQLTDVRSEKKIDTILERAFFENMAH